MKNQFPVNVSLLNANKNAFDADALPLNDATKAFDADALPLNHGTNSLPVDSVIADNKNLLMKEVDRAWEATTRNIEGRIVEVLLQCERFEWIADELRDDVSGTHSISAALVLANPNSRTSDIERALVSLALKATIDSGMLLRAYQPPPSPERLGLLHQIVKIEWENRHSVHANGAQYSEASPPSIA